MKLFHPNFSWLVTGLLCGGLSLTIPGADIRAQSSTEMKIQLMEEALRARDAGDYATARRDLHELSALSPTDPTVARLLAQVEESLAGQPVPAALLSNAALLDEEAEAIARAETDRLRGLLQQAAVQRKASRTRAREKKYDEALAALDAATAELPVNSLTQIMIKEIAEDRLGLLLDQTRYLLKTGDLTGARVTLGILRQAKPDFDEIERLARDIDQAESRAAEASRAVQASAPVVTVATDDNTNGVQLNKARSQYVAGAPDAALTTYREIEARDPGNPEAKKFIDRITRERGAADNPTRTATRSALLADVDQSWLRPGIYQEQLRTTAAELNNTPLLHKLDEIILPNVSFTKVEIGRVVSALSAASMEFDGTGNARRGVNIVLLDPSNQNPTVTLALRETSLKRVLDFVTQAVGYQYEVQADAVVVRPGGESTSLDTAFFPVSRATVLRMTGVGSSGESAPSNNPFSSTGAGNDQSTSGNEAPGMQAFLQQAGVNFEATPGSSLAYDGSSIIVTQTARNLERIRNILNRYNDIRQVEIEAKFMEVQEGALEELGVNWNVTTKATQRNAGAQAQYQSSGRSLGAAFSSNASSQQGTITRPESQSVDGTITAALNTAINNTAPQIPGTAYLGVGANALANISGVIGEFDVNAVVRALSQKQGTDLLSAPKVTVLSGNAATITVAQELRYPQSFGQTQSQVGTGSASGGGSAGVAITAGTPQEFTTRNVGVELKVTPTVEEDDYSISLDLNPRVTEFDGFVEYGGPSVAISGNTTVNVPSGFYQPIFSVRDISTKVTIWDGATLIMGGLTREEVKKVNDKIPVLGDIPLLGKMFRSKGESAQKRNLLIFVTANLLSPGGSPKKQVLRNVAPNSMFQNPVIVTPAGSEPRTGAEN
ncbi:MAG: type II secretory pathway, component PulD [Cephaloticoccus sp.]|nr:type II secretory pathway, component PulD [Cephaloticoccus sp.]MCF7760113.1 type II secretory pathway, component PulD [Cephaloticoccus sp.]